MATLSEAQRLRVNRFASEQGRPKPGRLDCKSFASERSPAAPADPFAFKIKLNKTFLEVHDSDDTYVTKPRASSDPGTDFSSEPATDWSERTERLNADRQEMERLSEHMSQIWRDRWSDSSSMTGDTSDNNSESLQTLRWPRDDSDDSGRDDRRKRDKRRPLSAALAVIAEIPEQVREFLEQTASSLVSDVHEQLQEMRTAMSEGESNKQAVQKLDAIPEIIMNSFEISFAKAKDMVQQRVDGAIAQLGEADGKEELAAQMRAIPEELARIAERSISAALHESQQRTAVLETSLSSTAQPLLASRGMSTQLGGVAGSLRTKAKLAVDEAIAAADSTSSAAAPNLGSIGHPELCPRPCLYFMRGSCSLAQNCEFCHLSHSKRPSHLDKRNRETLKGARFEEVAAMISPLIREKSSRLRLDREVVVVLDEMDATLDDFQSSIRSTRGLQNLAKALSSLTLRSLLAILQRMATPSTQPGHAQLAALVAKVKLLILPEASAVDLEEL